MTIRIINFQKEYLGELVDSFIDSFEDWDKEEASKYLLQAYLSYPDCCYAAVNDKSKVLGAVFSKIGHGDQGNILVIESLQVKKEFRQQKIGTLLLKEVIEKAKTMNISSIAMMAPTKEEFPLSWYKKIAFKETGWIELKGNIEELII